MYDKLEFTFWECETADVTPQQMNGGVVGQMWRFFSKTLRPTRHHGD
jgi:hypothetical protein